MTTQELHPLMMKDMKFGRKLRNQNNFCPKTDSVRNEMKQKIRLLKLKCEKWLKSINQLFLKQIVKQ